MKAAVLYANDDIRYEDYPDPKLERGHVLVKVMASGICGSDIARVLGHGAHYYPIVLGHEFAGEIAETARDVQDFFPGDRVSCAPLVPCMDCADCQRGNYALCRRYTFIGSRIQGGFAEYVALPAANAVKFDCSIPFDQGAFFEPGSVALHGLRVSGYAAGYDTAVLGAGTIGIFAVQWAKIFGAKSVTAFDISDSRLALAKEFGADRVVNVKTDPIEKNIYGHIFETAGASETMRFAFELAANKARICFIGTPSGDVVFGPKLLENMHRKEFCLCGSWMSYSAPFPGEEWSLTAHYFKTGQLKFDDRLIFLKLPLERAAEGFDIYKTPGKAGGKIMLYNK